MARPENGRVFIENLDITGLCCYAVKKRGETTADEDSVIPILKGGYAFFTGLLYRFWLQLMGAA
jgi:hypothetical protein